MIDEHFERYSEIGERNLVVLRLLQNWCAHAEVSREGPAGLIEQMTGLPLSMCKVTCKHERAPGFISMHLERNALSFYDRNCIDCTERKPVALPNLSELVDQRDSRRAYAERRDEEQQRAAREALALRRAHRERAFPSPTPAQASLLMLLDRLDTEGTAEAAEEIMAAVVAVQDELNDDFLEAIASVIAVGGMHRATGGLRALEISRLSRPSLIRLALESLKGPERAGAVVELAARHMEYADRDALRSAMPGLVWACRRTHFALPGEANGHTSALVSAHRSHPDIVESAIREALGQEATEWRQAACSAATALLTENHGVDAASLCDSLLASFRLPDSIEGEGPSYRVVAMLLGKLLCRHPSLILPSLVRHEADDHEQIKVGVFRAYCSVLDRRGVALEGEEAYAPWGPDSVQAHALSRVLALTTGLPNDDRLSEAVELLRRSDDWFGRFANPSVYVATMLGAAAMACARAEELSRPSTLIIDPRAADARQLDRGNDTIWLSSLAYQLVQLVAWTASAHGDAEARRECGELYLETLKALAPMADRFRSRLVCHLGKLYRGREWRNAILPEVYSALAHRSVAVRAAATTAYKDVCHVVGPDALPSLLHESVLAHLQDPYVAVHKGAVAAFRHIEVPQMLAERVLGLLVRIIGAYTEESAEQRDDFFVADALALVVRLVRTSEDARGLRYVVRVAQRLRHEALYSLLRDTIRHLRNVPGIAELLLLIPYSPSIWGDHESEFLLGELARLPRAEIARAASRIVEVGVKAGKKELHSVIPLMRILDANGESATARDMVATVLSKSGTDRANLRERLTLSLYLEALKFEEATANGGMGRVEELAASIRTIERALAEDEELNKGRRQYDALE